MSNIRDKIKNKLYINVSLFLFLYFDQPLLFVKMSKIMENFQALVLRKLFEFLLILILKQALKCFEKEKNCYFLMEDQSPKNTLIENMFGKY